MQPLPDQSAPQPWKQSRLDRWGQLDQEPSMQLRADQSAPELWKQRQLDRWDRLGQLDPLDREQ